MSKRNRSKKGSGVNLLLTIIMVICLGVIGVAGFQLFRIIKNYSDSNHLYDSLENDFTSDGKENGFVRGSDSEEEEEKENAGEYYEEDLSWAQMITVDLQALKAVNPDVIGWLYFEDGSISYPVMYSGDDEYYLHTAYDKTYAYAGSLFLEGRNTPDFNDSHSIIYGHNMRNYSMFGKLKYYYRDSAYYQDHQYFQIFTEEAVYRYHIFAYEQVNDDSFIYTVPYHDNEEFQEFIDKIRKISSLGFGDEISSSDHIITLSTCTTGTGRFVVHAERVGTAYYQ